MSRYSVVFDVEKDFFGLTLTLPCTVTSVTFCRMRNDNNCVLERKNKSTVLKLAYATLIFLHKKYDATK